MYPCHLALKKLMTQIYDVPMSSCPQKWSPTCRSQFWPWSTQAFVWNQALRQDPPAVNIFLVLVKYMNIEDFGLVLLLGYYGCLMPYVDFSVITARWRHWQIHLVEEQSQNETNTNKYRPLQEAAALEQGAVGVDRAGPDQTCPLDRGKNWIVNFKSIELYFPPPPPKKNL